MAAIDCVGFIKNCISDGILQTGNQKNCTLQDLATWLQIDILRSAVTTNNPSGESYSQTTFVLNY